MPTSSCPSSQRDTAFGDMKADRRASMKRDIRQHLRRVCVKDVLISSGISGHIDAALHVDRKEILVEVLRELADEIENM